MENMNYAYICMTFEKVSISSQILLYCLKYPVPLNKPHTLVLKDKKYVIVHVELLKY